MAGHVIVAGAGIIGLGIAVELIWRGMEVTVVDPRPPGSAASSGNTGWIVPVLSAPIPSPDLPWQVMKWLGDQDAPFRLDTGTMWSNARWLARFLSNCRAHRQREGLRHLGRLNASVFDAFDRWESAGLQFERRATGVTFVAEDRAAIDHLREENEQLAESGYPALEVLEESEIRRRFPGLSDRIRAGYRAPREEVVWPDSVLDALTQVVQENAALIRGQVVEIETGPGQGYRVHVDTGFAVNSATHLVIAAGAWSGDLAGIAGFRLPVIGGKGYSVTVDQPSNRLEEPLYLADARVACSPFKGRTRYAGMMELSGSGNAVDGRRLATMTRMLDRYLPEWDRGSKRSVWAGSRPMTPDGLPVIGSVPGRPGMYVATGHGMLGITMAPLTAGIIADLITSGKSEHPVDAFRVERF